MIDFIRAAVFWIGFILSTIIITFLLIFMFPFPFRTRYYFSRTWHIFNMWWLKITCGVDYLIEGLENIPDYPIIIISNHQSTWETMALQKILPPMVWVLKRELMFIPVFGWGISVLRPIAINRSSGKKAMDQLLEQGQARLDEGINVIIFPQGTRTPPGSKARYRMGGAMLAEKTQTPILPVAHNAGYYWPRRGFRKKSGVIRMVIGKPMPVAGMSAAEINKAAQGWIEGKAAELGDCADNNMNQ